MRAVAGEVLAQRGLEAAERGEHHAADEQHAAARGVGGEEAPDRAGPARAARTARRAGTGCHGACGRSAAGGPARRRRRRGRDLGRAAALARCAGPSGCHPGNGQPEESFTRHHPISMPIRPSRGRDRPDRAAGLAELRARDVGPLVALGRGAASARSRAPGGGRARRWSAAIRPASSSRMRSSSPSASSRGPAAGARRAAGAERLAARERRGQLERELALEPRDLIAQVAPRGRLAGDRGRGARADRRFGGDDGGQGTCLLSGRNVPRGRGRCRGRRSGRPP